MGPSGERHHHPAGAAAGPGARPWLPRSDLIVLPVVFAFDVLVFSTFLRTDGTSTGTRLAIAGYSAVGIGLLVFRRRAPVLVFAALWVLAVAALAMTDAYSPVLIVLVALEAVAELRSIRVSLAALAAGLVPVALLVTDAAQAASEQAKPTALVGSAVFYLAATVLAWGIGRWVRRSQRRLAALQHQHDREVKVQREETANAISAERLRIARELHDIVAHSVTIMVLHAAGAGRVIDSDPVRAKQSLTTIEQSGQQAMGELRRLLELLRESGREPVSPGSPLPGLAQLEPMVSSVRGSGVIVDVQTAGQPGRLDASIDLAAYRLVQEALTNITKHRGAGARATVSIQWRPQHVTVAVEDDGRGSSVSPPTLSTGHGLVGLRERIGIAGGDFAAGPTEAGGFRVAARLPLSALPGAGLLPDASAGGPTVDQGPDHIAGASDYAQADQ